MNTQQAAGAVISAVEALIKHSADLQGWPHLYVRIRVATYPTDEDLKAYKPGENGGVAKYEQAIMMLSDMCLDRNWSLEPVAFTEERFVEWKTANALPGIASQRFDFIYKVLGHEVNECIESYAAGLSPIVVEFSPDNFAHRDKIIRSGTIFWR